MEHRKTRILWVSFDFPPRLSAGAFRPVKLYKYLDKTRFEVDFVTHRPAERFRNAVQDDSLLADVKPTPRVYRVPTPIPHDALGGLISRLRRRCQPVRQSEVPSAADSSHSGKTKKPGLGSGLYRRFALLVYFPDHLFLWGWLATATALWLHLRRSYDIVYTTSYPESAHLPGLVLGLLGVPWIADYRYGGPLWVRHLAGYRKSAGRERVDRLFQQLLLSRATFVVTQSEPIRSDFCRLFGLEPSRSQVIPSGYDEPDFDDRPAAPPFSKTTRDIHLLHAGTMEGVDAGERLAIVKALNALNDALRIGGRRLVLDAVGSDVFQQERGAHAVQFEYRHHGTVAHHRLRAYLAAADCFLLSTTALVSGFIPSKLWEYLRAGSPILVAGPKDDVWAIVDKAGVGLHLGMNGDSGTSAGRLAAGLIARMQERPALHSSVRSYSWESRARSFQNILHRLLDHPEALLESGDVHV